jgi:pyrroline-5-carboxylate reductase
MTHSLAFIGGGAMAEALVSGLLSCRMYQPEQILVCDPLDSRRQFLQETYGVKVSGDNQQTLTAETIILAVKPNNLSSSLEPLKTQWTTKPLLVSILAGTSLSDLGIYLPQSMPIVRVMPNTPALVGKGIAGVCFNQHVNQDQQKLALSLFESVGEAVEIPESYFDAVTGLSGSGPAYVFLMIEALIEAGVYAGLPRRIARSLVLQTVSGACEMVKQTDMHPAELKEQVTSPGGTTAAGLQVLEAAALRSILIQGVQAATERSSSMRKN